MARLLGSTSVTIAVLAALVWLCAARWSEVAAALAAVPDAAFAAAIAVHVGTLVLRSEAWRLSLVAMQGTPLPRLTVHGANAGAFLAGTVQGHAAMPARVALLRRLAGERAPRVGQICVADAPIFLLELCCAAALLAIVAAGPGAWWQPIAVLGLGAGALVGARLVLQRFTHRPLARGLAVLGDVRRRRKLLGLVVAMSALAAGRVWLVLVVCGMPHGVGEVAWLFAALGLFGLLPLGPGAPPGATLAVAGGTALGGALAAGLLLSASSIAAVLVYGLGVSALRAGIRRESPTWIGEESAASPVGVRARRSRWRSPARFWPPGAARATRSSA